MVMYLWRAHNIVNARLHGDITEVLFWPNLRSISDGGGSHRVVPLPFLGNIMAWVGGKFERDGNGKTDS